MTWFKVDDTLHSHKKAMRAGTEAMGLWVLAGSWAADQLTDGWVPEYAIYRWSEHSKELAERLVSAGLWKPGEHDGDGGWWFHEWGERQPTREEVEARRKVDADRRARWREEQKRRKAQAASQPVSQYASHRDGSQCDNTRDSHRDATVHAISDVTRDSADMLFPAEPAEVSRGESRRDTNGASRDVSALPDPTRPDPTSPKGEKEIGAGRKGSAHPLPDTWKPNANHAHYATEHGLDLSFEADQFRAHAEANDRRQVRWDASFRQWMGNTKKWEKNRPALKSVVGGYQSFQNAADPRVWEESI
jgi:hypothetical protein